MSDTLKPVRNRILRRLRSRSTSHPIVDPDVVDMAVADRVIQLANEPSYGFAWSTGWLTWTANTDSMTITSSGTEYSRIILLRRQADGQLIDFVSSKALERERQFATGVGDIEMVAVYEETDQDIYLRCYPTPRVAQVLDALVSTVPARLTTDAGTVPFSRTMTTALELIASADIADTLPDEELARVLLGRNASRLWREQGENLLQIERERLIGFQLQSDIVLRQV